MLNVFKNLTVSTSFSSLTIENAMTAIKTGSFNHKTTKVNTGAIEASKEDKYSTEDYIGGKNMYNYLKVNSVMTWTPNGEFEGGHRRNDKLKQLTGYVYCDIDGIDPSTAKQLLSTLPFVYSVWSSLSSTGVGFLVKADWTVDNFKANYKALSAYFLAEHNLELDKTSDFTRTNVFSYDPTIVINENASNIDSKTLSTYLDVTTQTKARVYSNKPKYAKTASTKETEVYSSVKSNLDTLVENLNIDIDYSAKVKLAINWAINSKGNFVEGNRHNHLTSLIGTANKIGIPYDILLEEFENYLIEQNTFDLFDQEGFDNIYASFEHQASNFFDNLLDSATSTLLPTTKITVDKYLDNQIPTTYTKNTILVSPTGSGKSTYVMEQLKGKRVLVCPNTAVLLSFKSFKGTSVFYGEEKSADFTDIILTTQDSFELLTSVLEDRDDTILDYLIIIDEFHTLVSSANKGYKYSAINKVITILEENPLVVLGLTATPINTVTAKFYKTFDIIEVTQREDVKREIQLATYTNYRSFILERCKANHKNNTISVVYKNDKKSVDVLKLALEAQGLTAVIINADTKETEDYKELVAKGIVSFDVILTTSILKEGVSVKGKGDKVSVDYIVGTDNHFSEINQLSSRVRNAESITITLASSVNSYKDYTRGFLLSNVIESIDASNNFLLSKVNFQSYSEVEIRLDQKILGSSIKFDEASMKYVVDEIYKDYLIYQAETELCNINPLYLIIQLLNDTRFTVFPTLVDYSEDNKAYIDVAKEEVKANTVESQLDFKAMVDDLPGTDVLEKLDNLQQNGSKEVQSLSFYTKYVYARQKTQDLEAAIDKATTFIDSTRKFNDFKTQLELTELFETKDTVNSVSGVFFKEVKKQIKLNKEYTSKEINNIMINAAKKTGAKEYMKLSSTKTTQWFNMLGKTFDKKKVTTVKGVKTSVRVYTIISYGLDTYNYTPCYVDKNAPANNLVKLFDARYVNPFLNS